MPKRAKELSATEVRRLAQQPGFHAVGGVAGLYLTVSDTGAASWILRTKVGDRRRDIGLGGFPDVTLAMARDKAREAKDKIHGGIDPVAERKAARGALRAQQAKELTFRAATLKVHARIAAEAKHPKTAKCQHRLELPAFYRSKMSGHYRRMASPISSQPRQSPRGGQRWVVIPSVGAG